MDLYLLIETYHYEGDEVIGVYDSIENAVKAFQDYAAKNNRFNITPTDLTKLSKLKSIKMRSEYYTIEHMVLNRNEFD